MPEATNEHHARLLGGDGPDRAERIQEGRRMRAEIDKLAEETRGAEIRRDERVSVTVPYPQEAARLANEAKSEARQREASASVPAGEVPADGSRLVEWGADRGDAVRFYFSQGDYIEVSRQGDHLRIRGAGPASVGVLGFRSDGSNVLNAWILE